MLTRLDVQNFRGLRQCSLTNAGQVNLIVGRNDAGKTSVLEAIRLLCSGDPRSLRRPNRSRIERKPIDLEQSYRLAFYNGHTGAGLTVTGEIGEHRLTTRVSVNEVAEDDGPRLFELESENDALEGVESLLKPSYEVKVETTADEGSRTIIRLPLNERGYSVARTPHRSSGGDLAWIPRLTSLGTNRTEAWAHARRYSDLYRMGGAPRLLEILRQIEPRLASLVVLTSSPESAMPGAVLEVDIGLGKPLPLENMGDGFGSIIAMISAIGGAANGLCLIDEVENGLHYSLLPQVWRSVLAAARDYNAQVWATTHSFDCISALVDAAQDTPEMVRVHRLERREDGTVVAHRFDHEMIGRAMDRGLEVR